MVRSRRTKIPAEEKTRLVLAVLANEMTFQALFTDDDPLLRHVRTRIKSPQTNGVVERFFGTLKYEHLFRGYIGDGDALDMEAHRFRIIYNTIRPHQTLADRTPNRPT